jgi:cytochrome c2
MIYQNLVRCLSVALLSILMLNGTFAQDAKHGKELFLANCASCHSVDMKKDLTGPALGGVEERWAEFPREELYAWIRNSQGLIADNSAAAQPYASGLYQTWGSVMTPFPALKDADMEDLLLFIKNKYEQGCAEPPCADVAVAENVGGPGTTTGEEPGTSPAILWALALILVFGTILLARYINNLNRLAAQKTGSEPVAEKSFLEIVLNPTVVRILVFALVILGGYTTVNNAIGLGRQQNYAPEQPIKFSHQLHAGKNGIDCQYCHDGARRSKHAVIPGMNTCMNCHTAVNVGPEHGTAEILKIYASTGFNPISNKTPEHGAYFDEAVDAETRTKIYKQWLEEANKDNEAIGEREINKQLAAAKSFYGKTVEWIRIHNLPDHAYFNHSQHVSVGKVACQDCHGAVEEMAVVKQHAPLSMGWCVNCHRQTNVKFDENGYYNSDDYKMYEQYHKELTDGDRKGVTVEDIGGLECQKCHY